METYRLKKAVEFVSGNEDAKKGALTLIEMTWPVAGATIEEIMDAIGNPQTKIIDGVEWTVIEVKIADPLIRESAIRDGTWKPD